MRDYRSTVIAIILVICMVVMMMTILADADESLKTSARSAVLYEPSTNTFAYTKNENERLSMASTTKIMTALLAIERLNPDEMVTVPRDAVGIEGSSLYLEAGDVISVSDLIYSLLLQSANDAATLLAMKISGDIKSFADLMNEHAAMLGLSDTHFDNPHGLDSETHYTTAKDLAILASAAIENPTFCKITSTYKHSFMIGDKYRTVVNHNKLLKRYDGTIGVKTGYTDKSGRCLVSAAKRDGITLVAVTLNAPDDWNDHTTMLNYGFSQFRAVNLFEEAFAEYKVPLLNSTKEFVVARCEKLNTEIIVNKKDKVTTRLFIRQYAIAPIKSGDILGELIIYKNDQEIMRLPYKSEDCAEKRPFKLFDWLHGG